MMQDAMVLSQEATDNFALYHGDSCEIILGIPDNSVHFEIYSPPFSNLYVYTNSERDIGNNRNELTFLNHFKYLAKELFRVLINGRLMAVHCADIPAMKGKDGYIGLKDLPGLLIRLFEDSGFIYHSRVTIWKDPKVEMMRTKSLGLLHKQLKKDSTMSRVGIPDYLIVFRKPGDNPERVTHTNETFPVSVWQNYASPVWMDINPSDTLQKESAREHEDERHIAPLQLEVIRRCLELWTNPDDVVLDPFAGIGSSGYEAVKNGRRFLGFELKKSYYEQACRNLERAQAELKMPKQTLLTEVD